MVTFVHCSLSLHDALPICPAGEGEARQRDEREDRAPGEIESGKEVDVTLHATIATRTSRSEEHTSELQSQSNLVCRRLRETKNGKIGRTVQQEYRDRSRLL